MKVLKILALLLASFSYCNAQNLNGKYAVVDNAFQGSRKLTFENGKFTDSISTGDMGIKTIGTGTYTLENHRLTLKYLATINGDSSYYQLNSYSQPSATGLLSVKIEDKTGAAMQANVGFKDNNQKPLFFFLTDKSGLSDLRLYEGLHTGHVVVDFIGYYTVSIPVANLLAKKSTLLVKLMPALKTYIDSKTEIYEVTISSTNVILASKKTGKLQLTKIGN
ncbi:MAG: hypothetical protein P0Y49_21255 [Candidatus Pedobacter colombiensis]|uniref:Uncharacterized protein n=1 Tax=Candidatus Pedobacter colombiensis TaxID=3121371 RepID=A0AAJ6B5Z7_9SPHI|nr:hypothetical protein [Pedobacter sp.]WEK19307.1 MAG: hypothetical protein P0Y49_21255 [Pedobacter sp.]